MISIIVPIYNVEKYLPQCLDSLISQTCRDIEIILVDDGSPDKCPEICDAYAKKDARIKVVHQINGGVSSARNTGLKASRGEYIGFVDPDDWVAPEMYEKMMEALADHKADLAICGYQYCHADGSMIEERKYNRKPPEILSQKEMMRRCSDIPPTIRHVVWNKLFRRKLLQDLSFQESLSASEDVKVLTEYLKKCQNAVFLHEPYYYNRVRPGSATHGGLSIHDLAASFAVHEYMYRAIIDLYPDLKQYSQAFLLDVYLLKYKEAKRKAGTHETLEKSASADLNRMKKTIRAEGRKALFNREIYWKTRLAYLFA